MQYFIFLLGIICFFACQPTAEPSTQDCTSDYTTPAYNLDTFFPISPCLNSTQYVTPERYAYYDACFNPLNNNQIAFLRHDQSLIPFKIELCTFDFCTGVLAVLTDKCFLSPDWSTKGWIAFRGKDKQIWAIKSNGDSLTQLTFNGQNHNTPRWDTNGEYLMFWEDNTYFNHVIINLEAGRIDTVQGLLSSLFDWDGAKVTYRRSENGQIDYLNVYDYTNQTSIRIETIFRNGTTAFTPNFVAIAPDKGSVYWTNLHEVNETDYFGHRNLIAKMTNANWYGRVSVSGDGAKLLVERTDRRRPEVCLIEERFHLYLMDSDGSNERKIIFPE
jgi:hypothetical protein